MTTSEPWVDPDDYPEITADQFDRATVKVAGKVVRRGRPAGASKVPVSIRLDRGFLEQAKGEGAGWQSRLGETLVRLSRRSTKRRPPLAWDTYLPKIKWDEKAKLGRLELHVQPLVKAGLIEAIEYGDEMIVHGDRVRIVAIRPQPVLTGDLPGAIVEFEKA